MKLIKHLLIILATIMLFIKIEPVKAGQITTSNGDIIEFSNDYYTQPRLYRGTLQQIQAIIDSGLVAQAVNPFSVNDGMNTHFMGHSPGVFTAISNLNTGDILTFTDDSGLSRDYEMHFVIRIDAYSPVYNEHVIPTTLYHYSSEQVTLQYCDEVGVPVMFVGYPVSDSYVMKSHQIEYQKFSELDEYLKVKYQKYSNLQYIIDYEHNVKLD